MEPECSLPHSQVPPVPILSQLDPLQTPTSHFLKVHLNIILPYMPGSSRWSLSPKVFPPKPCIRFSSIIRAICSAHFILLDLIPRMTFGEGYRSLSSSLCNFLHSPVTSFLSDPNILPSSTLFSNTFSLCFSATCSIWRRIVRWTMMNLKFCGNYWSWPRSAYRPKICKEGLRKS